MIRPIELEECQKVQEIADSVMKTDFPEYSEDVKQRILNEDVNITDRFHSSAFSTFVAFADNKPVGFITGLSPIGGILNIHWLMVLKDFQGQGIGKKLLEEYINWAKGQGAHAVHLFCPDFNLSFYENLGFEKVGLVRKNYWGGDDYFMNKII